MSVRSIALSLGFHLALLAFAIFWDAGHPKSFNAPTVSATPKALQVRSLAEKDFRKELREALDATEAAKLQIARTDESIKSEHAPDTKEQIFLSGHNQAVDHNVRAARVGKFKNVLEEGVQDGGVNTPPSEGASSPSPKLAKLLDIGPHARDIEAREALTAKTGLVRKPASLGKGFSATDDYLPDVAIGANTLLNAREFKFYGFYERLREKLSDRWQSRLASAFQQVVNTDGTLDGEHITKVQVELDEHGALRHVTLIGSSGVAPFDRAATDAFREAAPFPNPPAGMIEGKGSVRIRWDFVVVASAEHGGISVQVRRDGI